MDTEEEMSAKMAPKGEETSARRTTPSYEEMNALRAQVAMLAKKLEESSKPREVKGRPTLGFDDAEIEETEKRRTTSLQEIMIFSHRVIPRDFPKSQESQKSLKSLPNEISSGFQKFPREEYLPSTIPKIPEIPREIPEIPEIPC